MGRIGNQLLEAASCISLALDYNDSYGFPASWEYRDHFPLANCFYDHFPVGPEYKEPHFHYAPIPYTPNLNLSGFFQSYKYFDHNANIIKGLLTPKNGFGIKWGYTSISVRRGDYVNNPAYTNLSMDYYQRAMDIINSPKYLVLSDDIAWCKYHFQGSQFEFSENNDTITDLKLGIACENNIICNSTFSWWMAYLNKNPNKIVAAPQAWFGPALARTHHTQDLIPPSWQRI